MGVAATGGGDEVVDAVAVEVALRNGVAIKVSGRLTRKNTQDPGIRGGAGGRSRAREGA
jgi:hypothetical protein